jgi:hypothetical protein
MDRDDIELVLAKAIDILEPSLKEKISMVEIFDLSSRVLQEIQFEQNLKDENFEYYLSRSEIEKILTEGDLEIRYTDGSKVNFILEEDDAKTAILENGNVIMWYDCDS